MSINRYADNRAVIFLRPEPALLELGKSNCHTENRALIQDSVFVVPNGKTSLGITEFLMAHTESILENELQRRVPDKTLWPEYFDYETLQAYFRMEIHTTIVEPDSDLKTNIAVCVQPKKPAQVWFNQIGQQVFEHTLSTNDIGFLEEDATIYLWPYTEEQFLSYLKQDSTRIFEFELAQFIDDSQYWPKNRTLKTLLEWYHFQQFPVTFEHSTFFPSPPRAAWGRGFRVRG